MSQWCVIADNGDENWVYGPFEHWPDAAKFMDELFSENPEIDYETASLFDPKDAK